MGSILSVFIILLNKPVSSENRRHFYTHSCNFNLDFIDREEKFILSKICVLKFCETEFYVRKLLCPRLYLCVCVL